MNAYLILEWMGRWTIPAKEHGGIFPGPYYSRTEAQLSIESYTRQKIHPACQEDCIARHKIVCVTLPGAPEEVPQ